MQDVTLLQDWVDYCADKKHFDDSCHFDMLFLDEGKITGEDLTLIFQTFPKAEELKECFKKVYHTNPSKENTVLDIKKLCDLAYKYLLEQKKVCERMGEQDLIKVIDSVKPVFITDEEHFRGVLSNRDNAGCDLFYVFTDYLSDHIIVENHNKFYDLMGAYYMYMHNYDMQYFLASPLIDTDINLNYFFELWKHGGEYALADDKLLVYSFLCDSSDETA